MLPTASAIDTSILSSQRVLSRLERRKRGRNRRKNKSLTTTDDSVITFWPLLQALLPFRCFTDLKLLE